jgi:hypothetical protein
MYQVVGQARTARYLDAVGMRSTRRGGQACLR